MSAKEDDGKREMERTTTKKQTELQNKPCNDSNWFIKVATHY